MYSTHVKKNTSDILKITNSYNILLIDEMTSVSYGNIKADLRKKGKPIPENDIWIAAIAQRYELTLVTRDKYFKEIKDINIKKW